MDRRSFLIGSGALLTASFVEKAEWYLDKKKSVVPLIETENAVDTIYFVNGGDEYELRLGDAADEFPIYTYRDALAECHNYNLPEGEPISLSTFRAIYEQFGIRPKQIDNIADPYFYLHSWCRHQSAGAQAHSFLNQLDLFSPKNTSGLRKGDLKFIDSYHPGNDYLGVRSNDPLSASLLQARLLELNQKIEVKIVEEL